MSEATAVVRIQGKDEASGKLRKVRKEIDDIEKSVQKVSKTTKKSGGLNDISSFLGIDPRIARGGAAGAIALIGAKAIKTASDLEELSSKARFTFKESFGIVEQRSREIADEVGRADSAILQFSTDMGAVIEAMGLSGPEMAKVSTNLAKLSVDMASFHNVSDPEAFIALRSGIVGETEAMKRFGVVMTQANLKAFALNKGITTQIDKMNQAQLTALRYEFIMDKTATVQGDAARTANSVANQLRRVSGNTRELFEELGKPLLPATSKGLQEVNEGLEGGIILLKGLKIGARETFEELRSMSVTLAHLLGAGSVGLKDFRGASLQGLKNDLSMEDVQASLGKTADKSKDAGAAAKQADGEFRKWMEELGRAGGPAGGLGRTKEELEELKDNVDELKASYREARLEIDVDIRELEFRHEQSMKGMREDIAGVEKAMKKLGESHAKTTQGIGSGVAESVVEQQNRIKELKKDMEDLQSRARQENKRGSISAGTNDDILDLKKQIEKEEEALRRFFESGQQNGLEGLLAEAQRRNDLTGFERRVEDLNKQREEEKHLFEDRKGELDVEKGKLEEKMAIEQEVFTRERQELELTKIEMQSFHDNYILNLDDMDKVTKDLVESMKKKLQELRKTINSINALLSANAAITGEGSLESRVQQRRQERGGLQFDSFASGGVVDRPTMALFGEAGKEAFVPLPDGRSIPVTVRAEKGGGKAVSVQIGEVHVHNEADEDRFIQKITRMIQLQQLQAA